RGEALCHLLADGALAHARHEVPHDLEVDIGLEQREPDLAHRARDRLLVEPALPAQAAEGASELVGEGLEHRRGSVVAPSRPTLAGIRPPDDAAEAGGTLASPACRHSEIPIRSPSGSARSSS